VEKPRSVFACPRGLACSDSRFRVALRVGCLIL
jgi:hypothetical protein